MLESGSREGEELRRVWDLLKLEEQQAADWLGEELQENLSVQVESVGGTSCDGSTRGKLSEERDKTWAKLIVKGLKAGPDQQTHLVLVAAGQRQSHKSYNQDVFVDIKFLICKAS